ncbi:MAG TPA: glycosyltransferase family 4 protein [Agriterribacter sp.]|nr:glycosyltransferase family 4 protein [Agriterribacter sp.]
MSPFVVLGKLFGIFFPLRTQHHLFLFFPNADIGGSPKVNIDIVQCVKDAKPLVIFSKKPKNNQFEDKFRIEGVRVIDLHRYIDYKVFHFVNFFFRGVIASWINKNNSPVLFGGECMFFYKMLPHVKQSARCIELSHLATWLPYNIGLVDRIDLRIFSTLALKKLVIEQYDQNGIAKALYKRLLFIDNAIDIPDDERVKNAIMEVVFIGRGAPQKRIHLIAEIAKRMHDSGDAIHFSFVGDVENMINVDDYPYCSFYGNVKDEALMDSIYRQSDVLILTSAFEGLPIVVMTMMAYGKVVLSTAVNGIPDYIEHMKNGMLIMSTNEDDIVLEGVALLRQLINTPDLIEKLGQCNREIAAQKFSKRAFCETYRSILLEKVQS